MSRRDSGVKPPPSSTMHAPHDHGPSNTFQSDFAQPVLDVHHARSRSVQSNHVFACMRFANV
jgi:hypothetical protein